MVMKNTFSSFALALFAAGILFCGCDPSKDEPVDKLKELEKELEAQKAAGYSYQVASVYDVDYAPGQYTNTMPSGMTTKEEAIAATAAKLVENKAMVHLGGWGGSVTVGFDHPILNLPGSDIRVYGNGFAGSSEPGVVYVARKDASGAPEEWYLLKHSMYDYAIHDYEITYYKPETEPAGAEDKYIYWTDNKGHKGYECKNSFHRQSYWPEYAGNTIVIKGEYLPTNSFDTSGKGTSYVQDAKWWGFPEDEKGYGMGAYGFCDAYANTDDLSTLDIDWAVDANGKHVELDRIDFVRVMSATHRQAGWLGEISTEFAGVDDLHLKGEDITVDTSVKPDVDKVELVYWPYDEKYENVLFCDEGIWQSDNGQLSFYDGEKHAVTNDWFAAVNKTKLGDTPNDMIQVNDTLIAIAVNWSNLVQFIRPDGSACGATEAIPNNRKMCVDDSGNLYITSYAHVCGTQTFTKGFVARIDPKTKKVNATVEVGWEPEGIRYYGGKLFVANSGGYSFSEGHDYENTISVIDAATMKVVKEVPLEYDFGQDGTMDRVLNLYGPMSQSGKYLCINSSGDYYSAPASTVIFNCEDYSYSVFEFASTTSTSYDGKFYSVGTSYSYLTGGYDISVNTIDPSKGTVSEGIISDEITSTIKAMENPFDIFISPYTGKVYVTDACSYASSGLLYVFDKNGKSVGDALKTYVSPGHFVALK